MISETKILDTAENGIFIVDSNLRVRFWNNWMVVNTGIDKARSDGELLLNLFPGHSFSLLERKVKIALKLGSSTYGNSSVDGYIVPIKLEKITTSRFRYMRQDVVVTPINDNEVSVIIYDTTSLLEAKAIIDEHLEIVKKQADTDPLTGCCNRKRFHELLVAETLRAARNGSRFSMIIFDIDNFKSVNDTYGHLVGDEVLRTVARIGSESIRTTDTFARWGGEEFIVLLPETGLDGAVVVADKVRLGIASHDCGEAGCRTCSFGVAEFSKFAEGDVNLIIYHADKALYFAKENGKNMVAVYVDDEIRPAGKGGGIKAS